MDARDGRRSLAASTHRRDRARHRAPRPPWTPERIIRGIRDLHTQGKPLNRGALSGDSIAAAATREFGSWDAALLAAGLDPKTIRRACRKWTPETIVEEIRNRHGRGQRLNYACIKPESLCFAGVRFFGSWDAALRAAGLDPARIRGRKRFPRKWTRSKVLKEIRRKSTEGEPLDPKHVSPVSLHMSAVAYFGSWRAALTAAGVESQCLGLRDVPDAGGNSHAANAGKNRSRAGARAVRRTRMKPPMRNKDEVLQRMLQREASGLPLSWRSVREDEFRLHADARRLFGSWRAALRAAGIDPDSIYQRRRWDRPAIVRAIRRLAGQRLDLNLAAVTALDPGLTTAAWQQFASWDNALVAAGLSPEACRKCVPNWTRSGVVREIRRIRADGGELNQTALRGKSLPRAATSLFGSWDAALRAAGLDPSTIRKGPSPRRRGGQRRRRKRVSR